MIRWILILAVIGLIANVLIWSSQNFVWVFLLLALVGGLLIRYLLRRSKRLKLQAKKEAILHEVRALAVKFQVRIGTERFKARKVDPYDNVSYDKWIDSGIAQFLQNVIYREYPNFKDFFEAYPEFASTCLQEVDALAQEYETEHFSGLAVAQEMDGVEFEVLCAERLAALGFKTELTKTSGDQGVDVIAIKDGLKVAIQCKRYTKPVGNSAVQEVVSGMKYYSADYGAVVTTSSYTRSAEEIARTHGIVLLHIADVGTIEQKLGIS